MILTGETRLKVKIFDFEHENDLEKAINEFIKSKKIIDIKYQISIFMLEMSKFTRFQL